MEGIKLFGVNDMHFPNLWCFIPDIYYSCAESVLDICEENSLKFCDTQQEQTLDDIKYLQLLALIPLHACLYTVSQKNDHIFIFLITRSNVNQF